METKTGLRVNGNGTAGTEILSIGNTDDADIIVVAEKRIEMVEKLLTITMKLTTANDWVDQNGKPYLTSGGAEKVARPFGVCWKILKTEKVNAKDDVGEFYFYMISGLFSVRNESIEAVGTCSSRDNFFAYITEWHNKVKTRILKPMSEIDETNIMKSAYSNCVVNGITRLLGLRNLTWEQVEKAGLRREDTASVKYRSKQASEAPKTAGSSGTDSKPAGNTNNTTGTPTTPANASNDGNAVITEQQYKALWKAFEEVGDLSKEKLMDFVHVVCKVKSTKLINPNDYEKVMKFIRNEDQGQTEAEEVK